MKSLGRWIACAAAGWMACGAGAVWAEDRIEQKSGKDLSGEITSISSQAVAIKVKDAEVKVPVNDIELIRYDQEPAELNLVRRAALGGRFNDALRDLTEKLSKVEFKGPRIPQMKADQDFFMAYCVGNLAFSGEKKPEEAEKLLEKFLTEYKGKSYHFLTACELLGSLRVSNGNFAGAETAFNELSQSTIESVKLRGTVAKGQVLLRQDKAADALAAFDSVANLPLKADDAYQQTQVRQANLGRAACLTATGKGPEAVTIVEKLIDEAPENPELYARAYNTLGAAYAAAGRKKEALLAYLHVDVLYNTLPGEHAESLFHLVKLWKELKKDQEAADAESVLKQRYASTTWAKQAK